MNALLRDIKKRHCIIIALMSVLPAGHLSAQTIPPPPSSQQWTHSRANAQSTGFSPLAALPPGLPGVDWDVLVGSSQFKGNYPLPVRHMFGEHVLVGNDSGLHVHESSTGALAQSLNFPFVPLRHLIPGGVRGLACEVINGYAKIIYASGLSRVICSSITSNGINVIWDESDGFFSRSPLTIAGNKVLFSAQNVDPSSNQDGLVGLVAMQKNTGQFLYFKQTGNVWAFNPDDDFLVDPAPAVNTATNRIYSGGACFGLGTGQLFWTTSLGLYGFSIVDQPNDQVIMNGSDSFGNFFVDVLDGATGALKFQALSLQNPFPPAVAGGRAYYLDNLGGVSALNLQTGNIDWTFTPPPTILFDQFLAANDGTVWGCDFSGPGVLSNFVRLQQATGVQTHLLTNQNSGNWVPTPGWDGIYNSASPNSARLSKYQ